MESDDIEFIEGGVYEWTTRLDDSNNKFAILIKHIANGNWSMLSVRGQHIHHWGDCDNVSQDRIVILIRQGTFRYICKLGDIFYGTRS